MKLTQITSPKNNKGDIYYWDLPVFLTSLWVNFNKVLYLNLNLTSQSLLLTILRRCWKRVTVEMTLRVSLNGRRQSNCAGIYNVCCIIPSVSVFVSCNDLQTLPWTLEKVPVGPVLPTAHRVHCTSYTIKGPNKPLFAVKFQSLKKFTYRLSMKTYLYTFQKRKLLHKRGQK